MKKPLEIFDCTEVVLFVAKTTPNALLVDTGNGQVWVPRSVVIEGENIERSNPFDEKKGMQSLMIADWFLEKELEDIL